MAFTYDSNIIHSLQPPDRILKLSRRHLISPSSTNKTSFYLQPFHFDQLFDSVHKVHVAILKFRSLYMGKVKRNVREFEIKKVGKIKMNVIQGGIKVQFMLILAKNR